MDLPPEILFKLEGSALDISQVAKAIRSHIDNGDRIVLAFNGGNFAPLGSNFIPLFERYETDARAKKQVDALAPFVLEWA